jgi:hypothetical protein
MHANDISVSQWLPSQPTACVRRSADPEKATKPSAIPTFRSPTFRHFNVFDADTQKAPPFQLFHFVPLCSAKNFRSEHFNSFLDAQPGVSYCPALFRARLSPENQTDLF